MNENLDAVLFRNYESFQKALENLYKGNFLEAERCIEKSIKGLKKLFKQNGNQKVALLLSSAYCIEGTIYFNEGNYTSCKESLNRSQRLFEHYMPKSINASNSFNWFMYANIFQIKGALNSEAGKSEEASQDLKERFRILEMIYEKDPHLPNLEVNIMEALMSLTDFAELHGEFEEALHYLEKFLEFNSKFNVDASYDEFFAQARDRRANLYLKIGELDKAKKEESENISHLERYFSEKTDLESDFIPISLCYSTLAKIEEEMGHYEEAERLFAVSREYLRQSQADRIMGPLISELMHLTNDYDLAKLYSRMGKAKESVEILERIVHRVNEIIRIGLANKDYTVEAMAKQLYLRILLLYGQEAKKTGDLVKSMANYIAFLYSLDNLNIRDLPDFSEWSTKANEIGDKLIDIVTQAIEDGLPTDEVSKTLDILKELKYVDSDKVKEIIDKHKGN